MNDNQWHTVLISRKISKAKLQIDNEYEILGDFVGDNGLKSLQRPYSFGGIDPSEIDGSYFNIGIDEEQAHFSGWIRNIYVGERFWEDPDKIDGAVACSEHLDNGAFFTGGYLKVKSNM